MNKRIKKITLTTLCFLSLGTSLTSAATLTGIRSLDTNGQTRIVFDMEGVPTAPKAVYDANIHLVKVILNDTINNNQQGIQKSNKTKGLVKGLNVANSGRDLVINLQVQQPVHKKLFTLSKPDRVVLDLFTDYEQTTTTNLGDSVKLVRWDKSIDAGRLKGYQVVIPKSMKFRVTTSEAPQTLNSFATNSSGTMYLGVAASAKESKENDRKLISTGNGIYPGATMQYSPINGYKIKFVNPKFVAHYKNADMNITGVNVTRNMNDLVLYTSDYGNTTKTNEYGTEVVLNNQKVIKVGKGNSTIGKEDMVLSGHGTAAKALAKIKVGDAVSIYQLPEIAKISMEGATTYSGGTEVLQAGNYVGPVNDTTRNGRTYLGTTKNNELLILAIDGDGTSSVGVTSKEGADILVAAGAIDGMVVNNTNDDLIVNGKYITHEGKSSNSTYNNAVVIS